MVSSLRLVIYEVEQSFDFEQEEEKLTRRFKREEAVKRIEEIKELKRCGHRIDEIKELLKEKI